MAEAIATFFAEPRHQAGLDRLLAAVRVEELAPRPPGEPPAPLAGKRLVFTGTLPTLGRREAQDLARRQGARVTSSVSKETAYLIAGADPGSKLEDARRLGVPVLDEDGFLELVASHQPPTTSH
jgi:DNA ligase (NAD+)